MKAKIAGGKRKVPPNSPATRALQPAERREASRQFAEASAANDRKTFDEARSTGQVDGLIGRTVTTSTGGAADFNLQLIEIARHNANCAFDFARRLMEMQSPVELFKFSVANARQQFESFSDQTRQVAALAQTEATGAAGTLAADTTGALNRVARSTKRG